MAAFGVPLAHEDDAERAVRAALATLERVQELGLEARVGIESGEVVADDSDSTFATGEAVNLAARLQAAAPAPNEILVGPARRAARSAAASSSSRSSRSSCAAGASRSPRSASSASSSSSEPVARPLRAARRPRDGARAAREHVRAHRRATGRAALVTIYGDPGVGKSRLAREFVAGLEGATVLDRPLPARTARASPTGRSPRW